MIDCLSCRGSPTIVLSLDQGHFVGRTLGADYRGTEVYMVLSRSVTDAEPTLNTTTRGSCRVPEAV